LTPKTDTSALKAPFLWFIHLVNAFLPQKKMRFTLSFLFTLLLGSSAFAQLLSPDEFLPHRLGEHFTPHEMQVDYVRHLAANSPLIKLQPYGVSNQKRPLQLAFISSEANLARLEAIRQNHLRRAGLLEGATDPKLDLSIMWISYTVHGNEPAGNESGLRVLHKLVNPANTQIQEWLKNTLVIIDPCLNPDGNSRYTHWYRNMAGSTPNPNPQAREHQEPWPGGRVNHYCFDLNRDWAWQTQAETRQRLLKYNEWMPQVHVDVHEQGYSAPYFFPPAAQPYHKYITPFQREFQVTVGKNNAKYFNEKGWLFFTRDVFDLFYPSYGDTYPTYNGAVGMTYEQGGIGAGLAVTLQNGDTLTFKDRVEHHATAVLATIETVAQNGPALQKNFVEFFQRNRNNPPGQYKTFVIKASNARERLKGFCELLDRNKIQYGKAGKASTLNAFDYQTGKTTSVKVEPNDLIVSAHQSRGAMAQILLEPNAELVDSMTYDITAWSLPYAHGLEAYASTQRMDPDGAFTITPAAAINSATKPYAYLIPWRGMGNVRFLAAILKKGIKVRAAQEPFSVEGKSYPLGTLVLTEGDNRKFVGNLQQAITALAKQHDQEISSVGTGYVESGRDFGSSAYALLKKPNVAILSGEGTSNNEFGQVWHYFDQELQYPHTVLDANRLDRMDLSAYNLLIMPEGRYRFNDVVWEKISSWVNAGGRLIAIGDALNSLEGRKGFGLPNQTDTKEKPQSEDLTKLDDYGSQDRRAISSYIPGAIFKVKLDVTHPLAYGLAPTYFSLKTGDMHFPALKNGWNVGTIGPDLMVQGFAGKKAKESMKNTVVFGSENKGAGSVIYLVDNPLFRAFWETGKLVMGNAVFMP
jgi:Zinc carboxypeptidase